MSFVAKYDELGNEQWFTQYEESEGNLDVRLYDAVILDDNTIVTVGSAEHGNTTESVVMLYSEDGDRLTHDYYGDSLSTIEAHEVVKGPNGSVQVTALKTTSSGTETITLSIKEVKKATVIVQENGDPHHMQGHAIVAISESALQMDKINDRKYRRGYLSDFISQSALDSLNDAFGKELKNVPTFKVYSRLTPADSISTARDGRAVPMPDFWTYFTLDFTGITDEQTAVTTLRDFNKFVKSAQLNHVFVPTSPPPIDDPLYPSQAAFHPTVAFPNWGINIEGAWDIELGCKDNVKIGIIDSGIYFPHIEFQEGGGTELATSIITGGYNFNYSETLNLRNDPHGHGTRSAGIITALRNNDHGVAGIVGGDHDNLLSPSPFYVMAVTNNVGNTFSAFYAEEMVFCEAILEAATETGEYGYGLDLINISWGHPWASTGAQTSYHEAYDCIIKAMWTCAKNGAIIAASRGDFDSDNRFIPATVGAELDEDDWLITVGSSTELGVRPRQLDGYSFSGAYGYLDVCAPGVQVNNISTMSSGDLLVNDVNPYEPYGGTSESAPHVLGVAALMYNHHHIDNGYNNNLAVEDIEYILETYNQGSNDETELEIGNGIIDATLALQHVDRTTYGYEVIHTADPVSTISTLATSPPEQTFMANNVYGVPIAEYWFSTYEVEQTYQVQLDPSVQIIDSWQRHSASLTNILPTGGDDIYFFPDEIEILSLSVDNNNLVTIVTKTHTKYCTDVVSWENEEEEAEALSSIGDYFPAAPDDVRTAISLYTQVTALGVEEQESGVFATISPNPATNEVNLTYHSSEHALTNILIVDNLGKVVQIIPVNGVIGSMQNLKINIQNLAKGVYSMTLEFGDRQAVTKKFVKQ